MISSIRGEIKYVGDNFLEVAVNDTGHKVYATPKTLGAHSGGENVELFTHLYLRENALDLYGFDTREERDFFEVLISISGIGPKGAIGILSTAPTDMLKKAIASGDTSVLTRVSGIGQKTASRIIIELKDKLPETILGGEEGLREGGDVIDALVGLGYTRSQAQQALREVPENIGGVENKVKEALKILGK